MSDDTMRCALCGSVWVGSHACSTGAHPKNHGADYGKPVQCSCGLKWVGALARNLEARAELERHTRELLARFLRDGGTSNAANFKKFEDDARALLAEWEARR